MNFQEPTAPVSEQNNLAIVLLLSANSDDSLDIISNIRKKSNCENVVESNLGEKLYIHDITTKYYSTQIALYPTNSPENLPDEVKSRSEGILIYFNPHDRSFLELLPGYVDFIKKHQIEFSIMLCKELLENEKNGITFKCIKDCYNMLDIIELDKNNSDEEEDMFNPPGYEELNQALRSVVWSNASIDSKKTEHSKQNENLLSEEELDVESELTNFENLLSQVMQFRPNTSSMSRDDRLNCAENFAEIFEKLIMQDDD